MTVVHNLPKQMMPFIGRETEIEEIGQLLMGGECRLLSLIGLGGMGKTRLSLEVARRNIDHFPDGVFFIPLQALVSAQNIPNAVVNALDYDDSGNVQPYNVVDYLSKMKLLLVMDNFEHVLDGAEFIGEILEAAPEVKILVTSREALKLRLEWIHPVGGMRVPTQVEIKSIQEFSSVKLFVERAKQAHKSFVSEDNLSCIIQICQLVGGMPLGIELAATWIKALTCSEIATEIDRNINILTSQMRDISERHRSIQAVFDSSWKMLDDDEQSVFMRLSIFRGTPTRQAIQSVTGANLMTIFSLTDKALLTKLDDGRFYTHELLRQYAYEKLEASGEIEAIRDAHSHYYLQLMGELDLDLRGRRQVEGIHDTDLDFENIRAAWHWALERKHYDDIGIAVEGLCIYLYFRARWDNENHLLIQAEEKLAPKDGTEPHIVWAMVLARNSDNHSDPIEALERALEIAKKHNNQDEISLYLHKMGHVYNRQNKYEEAIRHHKVSIPHFETAGDYFHLGDVYQALSFAYLDLVDLESSAEYNEKSLEIRRRIGNTTGQAQSLWHVGHTIFAIGDLEKSETYIREAIDLAQQVNNYDFLGSTEFYLSVYIMLGVYGDFDQFKQLGQETIQHFQQSNWHPREIIKFIQSLEASLSGNYELGYECAKESLRIAESVNSYTWYPIFNWALFIPACEQEDYETVRKHIHQLLKFFVDHRGVPCLLIGVLFSAILAAYEDNSPHEATQLLALASTHKASMSGWLKLWPFIERLHRHLENELGTEAYQATWEQGTNLDVFLVVRELMNDTHKDPDTSRIADANAALAEPLSERELEVLFKIAEGYSNKEIADQLYVGVSTVKKHITHIYGKLGVESRTQALIQAQELGLI